MNRRNFIQTFGGVVAAVMLPFIPPLDVRIKSHHDFELAAFTTFNPVSMYDYIMGIN